MDQLAIQKAIEIIAIFTLPRFCVLAIISLASANIDFMVENSYKFTTVGNKEIRLKHVSSLAVVAFV